MSVETKTRVFSLYLSTQTAAGSTYAPTNTTNFSSITWNINWDMIYGGYGVELGERLASVKFAFRMLSQSAVLTDVNNSGVLAIQGIGNQFSNSPNGLNLGLIAPAAEPIGGGTNFIMLGNTLSDSGGVACYLPSGYAPLTVLLIDEAGALMSGTTNFHLFLSFEIEC